MAAFHLYQRRALRRLIYFFYEYVADFMRWVNKKFREEAVNVYGFNSGFKREAGIEGRWI